MRLVRSPIVASMSILGTLLCAVVPARSVAQQASAITGRVTERSTGTPIGDVNVTLVGTTRGARTNEQGQFRIANVADGSYTVRVNRIGYASVARPITVSGGNATLEFQLTPTAVTIDEVVVTATGQSERKRENGNDVGIIKPGQDMPLAVTPTLTSVLASRTPGLTVNQNMGTPGTSARIRIRGSNSVSLSNEPLLIVDGIRVENNVNASSLTLGGATTSRFDDINPEDVESVEVLKGPAASALYGTAASNGVIQVTTKRGRSGRTSWRAHGQGGFMKDPTDYPANYYVIGNTPAGALFSGSCTIDRRTRALCTPTQVVTFNPLQYYKPQGTGNTQSYGISAGGGGDVAQYFIAGDLQRTQGIVDPSRVRGINLRTNVTATLRQNLNTTITANYIDKTTRLPYNDNNIYGVVPNGILGKAANCIKGATGSAATICGADTISHGFYSALPSTFYFVTNQQLVKRFVGGTNTTWQPRQWLTAVGQAGLDVDNTLDEFLNPSNVVTFINSSLTEGARRHRRVQNLNYSANGNVTATRAVPFVEALQSSTSIGAQYVNEQQHFTEAQGRALVPGTGSLGTVGAGKEVNENNQTIITIGGYAREQLGWRDRLFLTASLRADENSAFGRDFKLAYYPSVSASWVVTEEPFFRDMGRLSFVDQFRLRASYGQSGQRPGFRQADTYFNGVSVADKGNAELTAVVVGGVGNVKLKPEISAEYEAGFDMSFFNNRFGLIYTYYNKTTRDALIARTLAPSLGIAPTATPTQFVNLGKVSNSGNELSLTAVALDLPRVKIELNAAASTNRNKLIALGQGIPPIFFNGSRQAHVEGFPLGAFFQPHYTYQDRNNDGVLSRTNCPGQPVVATAPACEVVVNTDTSARAQYIGGVLPTREVSLTPSVTLWTNLRISTLFNYRGGNYLYNNTEEFRCTASAFSNCKAANDPDASYEDQAAMIGRVMTGQAANGTSFATSYGYIEEGDFWKLRELAVAYTLPTAWSRRAGTDALTFTVAGRNLYTWTGYKGYDPEINTSIQNFTQADFLTQPAVRQWTFRLDFTF